METSKNGSSISSSVNFPNSNLYVTAAASGSEYSGEVTEVTCFSLMVLGYSHWA